MEGRTDMKEVLEFVLEKADHPDFRRGESGPVEVGDEKFFYDRSGGLRVPGELAKSEADRAEHHLAVAKAQMAREVLDVERARKHTAAKNANELATLAHSLDVAKTKERQRYSEANREAEREDRAMVLHPKTIEVHSLSGLVDFLGAFDADPAALVVAHDRVELLSEPRKDGMRDVFAHALVEPCGFKFDSWYDEDIFPPVLLASFVDTADRKNLLKVFADGVKLEALRAVTDDGIKQQVTSREGVLASTVDVSPMVELQPFRTFPEVEQPSCTCAFRLREAGGKVQALLLTADGGLWKVEAIRSIKTYLESCLEEAEQQLPILA